VRLPAHRRAHLLGRMFQDPSIGSCADLTIAENMALAKKRGSKRGLWHCLTPPTKQMFAQALSSLGTGLENRLDTPMRLLSGGQRQAVSLLMATLSPLKILLLDEPTAALDPKAESTVLALIVKVAVEKQMTVLMVTHSLKHALTLGSRTIILKEGRVAHDFSGVNRRQLQVGKLAELMNA
jgi:putative ABC transport system ATP-binding protein